VHIAEAGEGAGLEIAVTESAVQIESTLVADRGLLVVGEPVVGVTQAVPGAGLPFTKAQSRHELQRFPAEGQRLVILTEQSV
jgi:hypothetical protein